MDWETAFANPDDALALLDKAKPKGTTWDEAFANPKKALAVLGGSTDSDNEQYARDKMQATPLPKWVTAGAEEMATDLWSTSLRTGMAVNKPLYWGMDAAARMAGIPEEQLPTKLLTEKADALNRYSEAFERAAAETDKGAAGFAAKTARGVTRSLPPALLAGAAGGPYGAIAYGVATEANQAVTEGKDAGLSGGKLAAYATAQGAIEGTVGAVMQKVGLGGMEKVFTKGTGQALKSGFKDAFKELGYRTLQEVPEELMTEAGHAVASRVAGVTKETDWKGLAIDTVAQTALTMGIVSAPSLVRGAKVDQQWANRGKQDTATEMAKPEFAQAWATANPEAAAKMAAIESPSRKDWETLTGSTSRGNPASRKAFADNVRATLSAEIKPDLSATSAAFKPDVVGQDPRWHYGKSPWKPEPSPESIADTVGTTPIANDPTPGRQSDVVPVEQVTAFSTPKVDYNLKDAPKPSDSIQWAVTKSKGPLDKPAGHVKDEWLRADVGGVQVEIAMDGYTNNQQVFIDGEHKGNFPTQEAAKQAAETIARWHVPATHPARAIDAITAYIPGKDRWNEAKTTLTDQGLSAAAAEAERIDQTDPNSEIERKVAAIIEKHLGTDSLGEWVRAGGLPAWMESWLGIDRQPTNGQPREYEAILYRNPKAWDWLWPQLLHLRNERTANGDDWIQAEFDNEIMPALKALDQGDLNYKDLGYSRTYDTGELPITPEQRAPAATATQETANALNPPVLDKTPTPAPEQPPAQEAVASPQQEFQRQLQAKIAELDSRGARDKEYRSILSGKSGKGFLPKGQTWRGRAKAFAEGKSWKDYFAEEKQKASGLPEGWTKDEWNKLVVEMRDMRNQEIDEYNNALDEVQGMYHSAKSLGNKVRGTTEKGTPGDETTIPGFDLALDYARNNFPHLLSGKGGDEASRLADAIKRGKRKRATINDPDVLSDAWANASSRGDAAEPSDSKASMVQSDSVLFATPPGAQIKLGGIGSWLAKWFKSAGHLPDSAYARKTLKDADVASEEKAVRNNANDLRDALRAELGTSKLLPAGQKKVDAALKGDAASLAGFSPRVQKAITAMRKHIDALSERLIASGVLDEQLTITVDENMGSYVTRSYQAHDDQSYKPSEKVRNDAFAHLQAAFPNENAQQINNRLDDMLAKAKEGAPVAAVKRSMLGAKDGGILKARKDIAPEIRAFLGEYNDPFVNYAKSATKMASLIANQEFLNDVKVAGQGKFFFDRDDPNRPTGYNVEFAAEGSEVLSPLNGLMTTPEIKQAFADINPQHITDGWLRTLLGANYVVKYSKTVLSPMTHQRNLTGNVMFAVQNGHWNVPMMATAAKATGGELAASLPEAGRALVSRFAGDGKAWREAFQRYTKLGIVGDGIHSGELKAALRDVTDTTKAAVEAGMFGYAVKGLRGGAEMATTLYQLEDAIWKIYAFENERARYKSAYEKAGQPKSDAELDAMSASVVSDTYPTYSKLPRAITALRRIPFIGSFVSFPAEVIRTGVMSIKLGVKEFNDPALKSIGAQRLAGNLIAIAATTALGAASQWLFNIDDEEEEALRKFLPPWQENAEILWLSKPKDGKAMYIDLSYTMPHSMLKEPYTAAMRGDDAYDSLKKGSFQFAEPFISEEILAGKLYDIARNTTGGESRREVYPQFGTDTEKAAAITKHLYGAFEPGGMTSARRVGAGLTGEVSPGGKIYNPVTEIAAVATGQRIQETDVAQSLKFDAKNYENAQRKTTSMFSAPFQREGKVSDEQIGKSYDSATTAARAQFEKLHQAAVSAKKLGVSEDEIRSILAANGVSKTRHDDPDSDDPTVKLPSEIDRVLAGKYEPYRISRNLYDHVSEMPGGKERLAAYEKASGDKESVAELHRIDVTNAANALSREKPDKPGDTDADRQKWFADRQEAIQWLRQKGVSGQDVLTTYLPELRKIKTETTRAEKRDRLKAALRGL